MTIGLQVNGRREQVPPGTLAAYVAAKGFEEKSLVVEHNGQIIKKDAWTEVVLADGDVLELLQFVGGG